MLSILCVLILNFVLLPYFLWVLVATLAAYFVGVRRKLPADFTPMSRFLIVIPAHDEEQGVRGTVESCLALDYPRQLFETLVLADNCGDRTAEVARQAGATVVERHDLSRKSKGFALEDLFNQLRQSGRLEMFDAVVVIDADTTVDPRLLLWFANRLESGASWIQAFYAVSNCADSWRTRLMTYAFCLINGTMLLGQSTLGLSAGLRGNGMCLATRGLRRVPWSSHGLAEDEEFSWEVRLAGETIAFEPAAVVYAVMLPGGGEAAASQRRRWEFGKKEARGRTRARMLHCRTLSWITKLTSMIELTLPSTLNIVILYVAMMLLNYYGIFGHLDFSPSARNLIIGSSALMTISLGLYALSPFLLFRLPWHVGLSLAYFPIYGFWKLAIMLRGRPKEWVRADRARANAQPVPATPGEGLQPPPSEPHG
jgi:cellulose synthase/poly-beta-1,6-N-acetylglucosamine synthase-like glycosyltransferase